MKLQRYTLYLVGSIILANYTFGIFTVSADNLSTVQTRVNQIQATDPLLPSGVMEQKGMFGTIIAALFDTAGKIRVEFLGNLVPGITSNNVPKWNGTNFVNSSISDDGTTVVSSRPVQVNSNLKVNGTNSFYLQGNRLYGDNGATLYYYSNSTTNSQIELHDLNDVRYGLVYGDSSGNQFGLLDGNGQWSYLAAKNSYTDFRINNSSIMRFLYPSGNVGIGTTSPAYKLDVAGTIHTNGDLMANRICNADGSSCNTFPLATGGGYWTVSGNNIYNNNSGNVGIGTNNPSHKLEVYSSSDWLTAKFDSPGPWTAIKMRAGNTSVNTKGLYLHYGGTAAGDNNQLRFGGASLADTNMGRSGPNSVIFDMDAGDSTLFVAGSSNVGIGTSSPNAKLDVAGGIIANAVSTTCIGNCSVATAATAPALSGNYGVNGDMYVTGNFGVGTSTPSYKMEVTGSLKANNYVWKNGVNWSMPDDNSEMSFDFANASGNAYWQVRDPTHGTILSARNNGNVGIGTNLPSSKLDVVGEIKTDYLTIRPQNTANEGGEMVLMNSNAEVNRNGKIVLDNYDQMLRIFRRKDNPGEYTEYAVFQPSKTYLGMQGNVGIGRSDPSRKLDIAGSLRASSTVYFGDGAGGDNIQFEQQGSFHRIAFNNLRFWDWDTGGDMVTFENGLVGIGTTGPSQRLTIQDGGITIRSYSPTVYLRDMDHYSGMIHMNSNLMYFLRGCGYDTESWCVTGNDWPLYLNMTDNNAVFGGAVRAYGFGNRSDIRLKKDIVTLEDDNIKKLLDLRPVSYKWKEEYSTDKNTRLGFIAQEVEKIYPSIISSSKNAKGEDIKSIYYMDLIAPLVKGFQVHNSEIEELKKQNMELQQEVEDLKRTMSR